jgi:formate dehydrogenase major subunit
MNVHFSRRQFMKLTGGGVAGSAIGAFGFGGAEEALAQAVRPFKLARATETRNTCPYCSVSCGMIMYSLGDRSKNAKAEIFHVEGDPDNPVNRGTLCPKGAGVLDFIRAKTRVKHPMHREPGSAEFKQVSWDWAMERIAQLMKEDRDANFVERNTDGVTVNRWPTTGFLAGCATSNEAGWLTYKVTRGLGLVQVDNQARI